MIKLTKTEAFEYWRNGCVVIIRSEGLEDLPAIMQGNCLCRYDEPLEGEPINELLQESDEFYYDENLDNEYYEMQVA